MTELSLVSVFSRYEGATRPILTSDTPEDNLVVAGSSFSDEPYSERPITECTGGVVVHRVLTEATRTVNVLQRKVIELTELTKEVLGVQQVQLVMADSSEHNANALIEKIDRLQLSINALTVKVDGIMANQLSIVNALREMWRIPNAKRGRECDSVLKERADKLFKKS